MRICLFSPTYLDAVGGAERDAEVILRGLQARGHEVFALGRTKHGPVPPLLYPAARYFRPPAQNLWPELLSWPLRRAHRRWRFDVVLAFYAYPTGFAAARIKRQLGVAVVTTPRGADLYPNYHALKQARVANVIRRGYRESDRIVSISPWLTERLHAVAGPAAGLPPIDLVPNGIDLAAHDAERDAARARPPAPEAIGVREPFVLHLARVVPVKGHLLAVEAVAQAADTFRACGVTYAIVGQGGAADDVRATIDRLGVGDIVKLLGTRTGVEKAWLLDRAAFMVSTSREEGFGNVVIEAMASGLPMLASDIPTHRELIVKHGWGELFRDGDAGDLARKLRAWLDADLTPLRAAALATRTSFTMDAMISGYENACRLALEARR